MRIKILLLAILIASFLLGACGPSPEQVATMTASAWTPTPKPTSTPLPTPTATPIPYDLTVKVTDEQGDSISWASISLVELNLTPATDDSGQASWTNLPQGNVTVKVTAQGYTTAEQQFSLNPGLNEQAIALARIPFGLLPSQACASSETMLYAEDFQDGVVESWGSYPPGTTFPFETDPTAPDNKVLLLNFGSTDGEFQVKTIPLQDNIVRRLRYMPGNHSRFNVGWGRGNPGYFVVLSADEITLNFYSEATGTQRLARGKPVMSQGAWHLLEISNFNGRIEVWADGKLAASYDGATSLTEGNIAGIGSAFLPPDSIVRIDDISICGLSAPFASTYVAP